MTAPNEVRPQTDAVASAPTASVAPLTPNPYLDVNRRKKAEKLATWAQACDFTSELLAKATEKDWTDLEQLAQVKPSSKPTRTLAVEMLAKNEAAREVVKQALPADPLAGLPRP